jgi:hypothetical protein
MILLIFLVRLGCDASFVFVTDSFVFAQPCCWFEVLNSADKRCCPSNRTRSRFLCVLSERTLFRKFSIHSSTRSSAVFVQHLVSSSFLAFSFVDKQVSVPDDSFRNPRKIDCCYCSGRFRSAEVCFRRLERRAPAIVKDGSDSVGHHGEENCLEQLLQADTQTAASTVAEPVDAHQTAVRCAIGTIRRQRDRLPLEAVGRLDRMHSRRCELVQCRLMLVTNQSVFCNISV